MKTTKTYIVLVLLIAANMFAFGQEIIGEFTYEETNRVIAVGDISELSDGTIIVGAYSYSWSGGPSKTKVFKITPSGELLDSLSFYVGYYLESNPFEPDSFILTSFDLEADETRVFKMVFFDADFTITREIEVPICSDDGFHYASFGRWFIDNEGDYILNYWKNDVLHFARIGLDGTLKTECECSTVLPANYTEEPAADSSLRYTYFGVYSESPLRYCQLGQFIPQGSGPWPIFIYVFDAEFNLVERHVYDEFDGNVSYDGYDGEHIVPWDSESYLYAEGMRQGNKSNPWLIKLDREHNPIATASFNGGTYGGKPYCKGTAVRDDKTIYFAYYCIVPGKVRLARLDDELNVLWDVVLPSVTNNNDASGHLVQPLQNGNVATATISYRNSGQECLNVCIINDAFDGSAEFIDSSNVVYPNPVMDFFSIDGDVNELEVFDLQGNSLYSGTSKTVDVKNWSTGVYFVRVAGCDGTVSTVKFVKVAP